MKTIQIVLCCAAAVFLASCGRLPTMYASDGSSVHSFARNGFIYSRPGQVNVHCNGSGCEDGTLPPTDVAGLPLSNVARMEFDGQTFFSDVTSSTQH